MLSNIKDYSRALIAARKLGNPNWQFFETLYEAHRLLNADEIEFVQYEVKTSPAVSRRSYSYSQYPLYEQ